MKQLVLLMLFAAAITSCGSNDKKTTGTETSTEAPKDPMVAKGIELVVSNDCLGCHKPEEKVKGPSYTEIAKRYAGQPAMEDTLVQRIIKGSRGHWGDEEMTAHPTLTNDEAKAMVKYVLSLNK